MFDETKVDFSKMSYEQIKEYVDKVKVNKIGSESWNNKLLELVEIMQNDPRKNIKKLSERIVNYFKAASNEIVRVKSMYDFDKAFCHSCIIAGVDEVGRGPLAGPIVSASVILNLNVNDIGDLLLGIKDSKKLSSKSREELSEIIKTKAVSYSIAEIDNFSIDARGISWCNNQVFKNAVNGLEILPDMVISDGYPIRDFSLKNEFVIKGDEKSASVACASIIAKVYRDNLMKEYSKVYANYKFEENSGYGTKEHIEAIKKYGPCKIHRVSFLKNLL